MPRKQVTRALGAKPKAVGTRRKNSPGQYEQTTDRLDAEAGRAESSSGMQCIHATVVETAAGILKPKRCQRAGTTFTRWAWYCAEHAPEPGNPNCHHCVRSPMHGRWICQTCWLDLGAIE